MTQDEVQAMIADHEEKLRPYYLAQNPGEREAVERMIRITRAAPALYEALRATVAWCQWLEDPDEELQHAMKMAATALAMVDEP